MALLFPPPILFHTWQVYFDTDRFSFEFSS